MVCPKCNNKKCAKNGWNSANLRKYICWKCKYSFCPKGKFKHICSEVKIMVLKMYLEGLGFRSIGRLLNISHVSAYNIVQKEGRKLDAQDEKIEPDEVVEMDEIHTYVGQKKTTFGCGLRSTERQKSLSVLKSATGRQKLAKEYGKKSSKPAQT